MRLDTLLYKLDIDLNSLIEELSSVGKCVYKLEYIKKTLTKCFWDAHPEISEFDKKLSVVLIEDMFPLDSQTRLLDGNCLDIVDDLSSLIYKSCKNIYIY